MAPKSTSPTKPAHNASLVEINVEAVALCPYALDDARVAGGAASDNMQIGVGIAGLVARDFTTDSATFKRGDEVWSRVPVSIRPDVKRVKLDAAKVFKLAAGITLEQAATLGDSGLMALHAVEIAGVKTDSRLLIHGAANPFGSAAISLATYLGADVIATVDLPHEQRVAISAGAHQVGLARSRDASSTLRKWIGKDGVKAVLDGNFLENAALNLQLMAPGGCLVTCLMKGSATAETESAFARALANFAKKNIQVKTISGQDLENPDLVDIPRLAHVISDALAGRRYQPVVGQVLSPDELVDAMAMLNQGHMVGSFVLKPGIHPT
jgi:NADPH:quinone reductase-like Zn-dependent oxidoreductase